MIVSIPGGGGVGGEVAVLGPCSGSVFRPGCPGVGKPDNGKENRQEPQTQD